MRLSDLFEDSRSPAADAIRAFLDLVEDEARDFGIKLGISNDRGRLAHFFGGSPAFPGFYPKMLGGNPNGFWMDYQDARSGEAVAVSGALFYSTGPWFLSDFIGDAGLYQGEAHKFELTDEALDWASQQRGSFGFSGGLLVRKPDRGAFSKWCKRRTPLMNKAIMLGLYDTPGPELPLFITFVRDAQMANLAPFYGLDGLLPSVVWHQQWQESVTCQLGHQSRESVIAALEAGIQPSERQQTGRPALEPV